MIAPSPRAPGDGAQGSIPYRGLYRLDEILSPARMKELRGGGTVTARKSEVLWEGPAAREVPRRSSPPSGILGQLRKALVRVQFPIELVEESTMVRLIGEVRWLHGAEDPEAVGRGMGLQIERFETNADRIVFEAYVASLLQE